MIDPKHDKVPPKDFDKGHEVFTEEELKRIKDFFPKHSGDKCFHCGRPATRSIPIGVSMAKNHFKPGGATASVCDEYPDCIYYED